MSSHQSNTRANDHEGKRALFSALTVIVLVIVGAIAAWAAGAARGKEYTGSVDYVVQARDLSSALIGEAPQSVDASKLLGTFAAAGGSSEYATRVATALHEATESQTVQDHLHVSTDSSSNVIVFEAKGSSARAARALGLAVSSTFPSYFNEVFIPAVGSADASALGANLAKVKALLRISPTLRLISDPAHTEQTNPSSARNAVAGGLAGAVLGLILAAWRHRPAQRSTPSISRPLGSDTGQPT